MLKSDLGALVKMMIKIEILYWKMVKTDEFNFLKVKIFIEFNANILLLGSLA